MFAGTALVHDIFCCQQQKIPQRCKSFDYTVKLDKTNITMPIFCIYLTIYFAYFFFLPFLLPFEGSSRGPSAGYLSCTSNKCSPFFLPFFFYQYLNSKTKCCELSKTPWLQADLDKMARLASLGLPAFRVSQDYQDLLDRPGATLALTVCAEYQFGRILRN